MTKPDLTSELNSLLGYMSVATLSQGKVKQLSFVWLSPGTEERRSDFRARSNLLLKISSQQHCLPADLDWRCLDGKSWSCFGWLDLLPQDCCVVRGGQGVGQVWVFCQSKFKCSSYLDWIISKHQWLVLWKKCIFKIKIFYVAYFLVSLVKGFGYTSLHFYVCICLFSSTLITKLLLWTCVVNSCLAAKLFWNWRKPTIKNPLIYTANDIP